MPAPFAAIVPTVELPPAFPFTLQVTAGEGLPVPETVAVKTCAPKVGTAAVKGDTLTTISSSSVTIADALAAVLATLVAVTVSLPEAGRIAGAVYKPPEETVPEPALPPEIPFTLHVTFVLVVPVTLA